MAVLFIVAGANHFLRPDLYLSMMPGYLPRPELLNLIAGAAEVLGGAGALFPPVRRAAGWGLVALLLAVFPANLHVAINGWPGVDIPAWVLWARVPFQAFFILWVYDSCLRKPQTGTSCRL